MSDAAVLWAAFFAAAVSGPFGFWGGAVLAAACGVPLALRISDLGPPLEVKGGAFLQEPAFYLRFSAAAFLLGGLNLVAMAVVAFGASLAGLRPGFTDGYLTAGLVCLGGVALGPAAAAAAALARRLFPGRSLDLPLLATVAATAALGPLGSFGGLMQGALGGLLEAGLHLREKGLPMGPPEPASLALPSLEAPDAVRPAVVPAKSPDVRVRPGVTLADPTFYWRMVVRGFYMAVADRLLAPVLARLGHPSAGAAFGEAAVVCALFAGVMAFPALIAAFRMIPSDEELRKREGRP